MKSILAAYEEQRNVMEAIRVTSELQDARQSTCARCQQPHGAHVRLSAGVDLCPDTFYAPESSERTTTLRLVEPPAKPTGEVGRVQPNWFAVGHGAFWAAYLGAVAYLLFWLVPELAEFNR